MSPNSTGESAGIVEIIEEKNFDAVDSALKAIYALLNNDEFEKIRNLFLSYNITDQADILEKCDPDHRIAIVILCKDSLDPELYAEIDSSVRKSILESFDAEEIAKIISELESDDALELISKLDKEFQQKIIKKLSAANRAFVEEGLMFPEKSAGRLMQRSVVAIPQFWTVGKTLDYLRAATEHLPDEFQSIYIVDPHYHVVGEVPVSRILSAQRSVKIENLSNINVFIVKAKDNQEDVAYLFQKEHLFSVPVTDDENRLIGTITADDIIDVIQESARSDIFHLAGLSGTSDVYQAVSQTTIARFPWLMLSLVSAFLVAFVVGLFEMTLDKIVALAVLMPVVSFMGANAGVQTLTVTIRALAMKELSSINAWRFIAKEVAVSIINGIGFAFLIAFITFLWFDNMMLALVISLAIVINIITAGLFGIGIPLFLDKIGADPALASAVFLTTVTDVVGFFAFLGLAGIVLL